MTRTDEIESLNQLGGVRFLTDGTPVLGQIKVSGIWLRREGDHVIVLVERNGDFHEVIREHIDSPFSHIVEPEGIFQRCEIKAVKAS